MDDPIRELLKNTGWSYDDLMKKLQHFKSIESQGQANTETTEAAAIKDAQTNLERNDTPSLDPNIPKVDIDDKSTIVTKDDVRSCTENAENICRNSKVPDDEIIQNNCFDKSQSSGKVNEKLREREHPLEVTESKELSCVDKNEGLVENIANENQGEYTEDKTVDEGNTRTCIEQAPNTNEINKAPDDIHEHGCRNEDELVKPTDENVSLDSDITEDKSFDKSNSVKIIGMLSDNKNPIEETESNDFPQVDRNHIFTNKCESYEINKTSDLDKRNVSTADNTRCQDSNYIYQSTSIIPSICSISDTGQDNMTDSKFLGTQVPEITTARHCPTTSVDLSITRIESSQDSSEYDICNATKENLLKSAFVTTEVSTTSDSNCIPKVSVNLLSRDSVEDVTMRVSKDVLFSGILNENQFEIIEEDEMEESVSNDKTEANSETETSIKLEDIRNNLKMQLNNLRTKKKDPLLNKITKQIDFDLETNKKLDIAVKVNPLVSNDDVENKNTIPISKRTSDISDKDLTSEIPSIANKMETTIVNSSLCLDSEKPISEECLYTQTNDFEFVIASVEGGIDFNTEDNLQKPEVSLEELYRAPEETQVIDEIRKIIQKPKPKIYINKELAKVPDCFLDADDYKLGAQQDDYIRNSSNENTESYPDGNGTVEEISPFVSNSLDEFLTEDAQLNISYNVPKCEAEEGLKNSLAEDAMLLLKKVVKVKGMKGSPSKQSSYVKAKTVAQKRKLLEREKVKEKKIKRNVTTISDSHETRRHSYILFDNTKIWVNCKTVKECVATIYSNPKQKSSICVPSRPKKSLLKECKKFDNIIQYKPGPLCRKSSLQITGAENWETHLLTLPKIYLEVYPQVCHPLPPDILCRIPNSDGNLSSMHVDFALSAVKTKGQTNSGPGRFVFPLKYRHNQEQLMIRKKRIPVFRSNSNYSVNVLGNGEHVIADVIEGLIKYVEIKEIEESLIKQDNIEFEKEHIANEVISPENNKISVIKKRQKKSKIDLELLRLNCKLVNVEVEDKLEDVPCNKSFCQLGCVCNSLKCENISTYHCQKLSCMFECTCPKDKRWVFDHKLTLPAGSDLLSTDTVSRIEDEAKKNLARVEREFTQTIIYANDKTIVVGLGGRNKVRRAPKVPKKFDDYIGISDDLINSDIDKVPTRECKVKLVRLNLSDITPYCLNHNSYDCECKGLSEYTPLKYEEKVSTDSRKRHREEHVFEEQKMSKQKTSIEENISEKVVIYDDDPLSLESILNNRKHKKRSFGDRNLSKSNKKYKKSDYEHEDGAIASLKPADVELSLTSESRVAAVSESHTSARTRGVPQNFRRHPYDDSLLVNDFIYNISDSAVLQLQIKSDRTDAEKFKLDIIENSYDLSKIIRSQRKRKQILEVRSDDVSKLDSRPNKQTRMSSEISSAKSESFSEDSDASNTVQPYFPGEVILYNRDLLKEIGSKALHDGYARVIPWKVLCQSFQDETIHIWCMIDQPSRLLINKSGTKCPKNYVDIKKHTRTTDVISWIINGKLPSCYVEDQVSLILKETKNNYEICGMCNGTIINSPKEFYNHKDINGQPRQLSVKMENFKRQELLEEHLQSCSLDSLRKSKLYMWAALPDVFHTLKWRMIFLNSDFTYLFFKEIKYSIKYTDLVNLGRIAKDNKSTVSVRHKKMADKYVHQSFGIYFEPKYTDRIFIGPYQRDFTETDIETLRYIDKTLVCTESFNKMRGIGDYKCGHWLIQRQPKSSVIDLTEDEPADEPVTSDIFKVEQETADNGSVDNQIKNKKNKDSLPNKSKSPNLNAKIRIVDVLPREPEDFNRYLITNIPHFGYLGAFQHPHSSEIDISWPFEKKVLRFRDTEIATKFLQE